MQSLFEEHLLCYTNAGIHYARDISFVPTDSLYKEAINISDPEQMICCICYSHELNDTVNIENLLAISKKANSKIHLTINAAEQHYQIPKSFIINKKDILQQYEHLFKSYLKKLLCKTDGLGGGFNVSEIDHFNDLTNEMDHFAEIDQFILQEKIDKSIYNEYAIDFIMKESGAEFYSARKKLTHHNQWFGNLFEPTIKLSNMQKQNLDRCLHYLQKIGYISEEGYVCCIDVLQDDTEQYILEVNARWSGGFPIARFLKKINYHFNDNVTAYMDYISINELDLYMSFVKIHLLNIHDINIAKDTFKVFPIGFSPIPNDNKICVWISVFGDFRQFSITIANQFSTDSFTMAKFALRYQ